MKIQKGLLAISVFLIAAGACKRDESKGVNQTDWDFIQSISYKNNGEIELAQLVAGKTSEDGIKTFATTLNTDHQSAEDDLQYLATKKGASPPLTTDSSYTRSKNDLTAMTGRSFDSAFLHIESVNQQLIIDLMQTEIAGGNDQNIKSYTNTYLPLVRKHKQNADSLIAALHY